MTMPLTSRDFAAPAAMRAGRVVEGLAGAIDAAALAAPPRHRFLRQAWFVAAIGAYGGVPRTVVVDNAHGVAAAMPLVSFGPRLLRLAAVPGCYWPMRSLPIAQHAADDDLDALLQAAARGARAIRIGPVMDDDPAVVRLVARARANGWAALNRTLGDSWRLPLPDGIWPKPSTAKKNRWFERKLGELGAVRTEFVGGAAWTNAMFARFAAVEAASWVGTGTDLSDAKFVAQRHRAFWQAAIADPDIAGSLHGALLVVGGRDAAFSFAIDRGDLRHIIANGFDPAFAAHSPGRVLAWHDLAQARARGMALVDWGVGDSGYKRQFGAERGPAMRDWLLLRPGALAALARLADSFRH